MGREQQVKEFIDLLRQVTTKAGNDFSGVGLLVSDDIAQIPIISLRNSVEPLNGMSTCEYLLHISKPDSLYHDGFHILSSDMQVSKVSQYFSPPIIPNLFVTQRKPYGGRYMAALFGSGIPQIKISGIASLGFGFAVFEAGREIYFEDCQC